MKWNYYEMYKQNLKKIINIYGYKYYWLDISNEKFYNNTQNSFNDFVFNGDKFLLQYQDEKIKLGQDILQNGTYTPMFFITEDNKKKISLGKHRLYSLLLCNKQNKIEKPFLFIEYPINPNKEWECENTLLEMEDTLYFFDKDLKPYKMKPKTIADINKVLLFTGDSLSSWFFDNKIIPDKIFNDRQAFEAFLKEDYE